MKHPIYITDIATISALGSDENSIWQAYKSEDTALKYIDLEDTSAYAGQLPHRERQEVDAIKNGHKLYQHLDDSVLFALHCARRINGVNVSKDFGVNIGSSRGATGLFERYHKEFLESGQSATLSSPTTTLGNISSWVAQDLKSKGPNFSHSITCSTAFHSIVNGIAWLASGMADRFLVGGAEAPLTSFTVAQMRAMKIYAEKSNVENHTYPNQSLNIWKTKNSMILGEGAGIAQIQKEMCTHMLAQIIGIGYGMETLEHSASISKNAICLQESMRMAIGKHRPEDVDIVICHAPGTVKGDLAEVSAVKKVFGKHQPALTSNKWKLGHTFGASGMLSLELAILMLKHQEFVGVPFIEEATKISQQPLKINTILINTVGFGGNAVSILLSKAKK